MKIDNFAETNGATLQNIVEGCGVFQSRVIRLLASRGIEEISKDKWYPLQPVLSVMEDLAAQIGPNILTEIGKRVHRNSAFPEEIQNFEQVLEALDEAYQANHRRGDIGCYDVSKRGQNEFRVRCDNPYPAKFNQGLLRGLALRYAVLARITEVDSSVSGGEFLVSWS